MKTQIEAVFQKLESDQLPVQASGMDEARTLVAQLVGKSVETLFSSPPANRYVIAEKLFAMGAAAIPELESKLEDEEVPEATTHAALILLKLGSTRGVPRLIRSLKDGVGPIGTIAQSLSAARIVGASEAITEALTKGVARNDPYVAASLISALRELEVSVPNEALLQLEESAPHIRRLL